MSIDPKAFRDTLGRFASGITVILADDDGPRGMTASAFLSVSMDPPLVLVSVQKKAHMHARLLAAGTWTASVLRADQSYVSNHFAGRPDPLPQGTLVQAPSGRFLVNGAIAWVDCSTHQVVDAGDHSLFLGLVTDLGVADGAPLVYWRGGYREIVAN